jgi:hypothetical protein
MPTYLVQCGTHHHACVDEMNSQFHYLRSIGYRQNNSRDHPQQAEMILMSGGGKNLIL